MTKKQLNFLIVQADQLAARALAVYGNPVCRTPNLDSVAATGTVFKHSYCNYPLCGPSRASMMTGLLPFQGGFFDNGTEYPATIPSFAHYLRMLGYQTCLSGKMHFIGPDQLHGFEERLTSDIYPSDFNWMSNWTQGDKKTVANRLLAAQGEVQGIKNSGIYERTVQLDYDEEVVFKSVRKIHDYARSDDPRPFCLVTSLTHPHDPFAVPQEYWDRYRHDEIDMPVIPRGDASELDAHSRRLYDHIGVAAADMSDAEIRTARHAYYAAISFIDDQLGKLIHALEVAGVRENTAIIFVSDHGEALGERGLWFKRSFYDVALNIPMIVSVPGMDQAPISNSNASLVDLLPTLVDLAAPKDGLSRITTRYSGKSLVPAMHGQEASPDDDIVFCEMAGDGLTVPAVAVLDGRMKYIHCDTDPALMFDRSVDPHEKINLVGNPDYARVEAKFRRIISESWDFEALTEQVLECQRSRRIVENAHSEGTTPSWDFDQFIPGSTQYFRALPINPSASNYSSTFKLRLRPDSDRPNERAMRAY